jgi:hypothetical protein
MPIKGSSEFIELDNMVLNIFDDVLKLFAHCYKKIIDKPEKFIRKDMGTKYEDYYRNKLIIDYVPKYAKNFGLESLEFIPGADEIDPVTYISRGNPDIKIININFILDEHFSFNSDIYFTFECKRFGENANPKLYVNKGIKRFIEKKGSGFKYASNLPFAGMIGFIEEGNPNEIISEINNILKTHKHILTENFLNKVSIESDFEHSYCSNHRRGPDLHITLHHIMYDYNGMIH